MKATEKQKAYMRGYYQRTKEVRKPLLRAYYQENREQISITKGEHYRGHREEMMARNMTYYRENRERILQSCASPAKLDVARRWRAKLKRTVLTHYGNGELACVKCGFDNVKALSIDHIKGGGNAHRRALHFRTSARLYCWLKNNDYPEGYQTLCMNCQFVKKATEREQ